MRLNAIIADTDGISTPELISFDVFGGVMPQYLVYCLKNTYTDKMIEKRSYGIKMPRVDAGFMANLPIPVPPISEQMYIVDKVEKANAALDAIDRNQSKYQNDNLILKGKLIDAAIQGKLTEQLPEDGTAEELYQQIQQEKRKLEAEGKIKKEKALPPVSEDEVPFDIPANWIWIRLGDMIEFVTSGSRDWAQYYSDTGDIFLRMGNLSRNSFELRLDKVQHVKLPMKVEGQRTSLNAGDLLLSITGEVGTLGLIPDSFGKAYINQHTAMIRFLECFRNRYVPYLTRTQMLLYRLR